jgi:hypothetical protein
MDIRKGAAGCQKFVNSAPVARGIAIRNPKARRLRAENVNSHVASDRHREHKSAMPETLDT